MVWIIDRYLIKNFVRSYLIVFLSLVGLYVVIDAFTNLDKFAKNAHGLRLLQAIGGYYLYRIPLFFDRLCGVIAMMAAMFTVSWMQKNNELIALLAAGVRTHRVLLPVILAASVVNSLGVCNQELIIPRISDKLVLTADDDGERMVHTHTPVRDANGVLITGPQLDRKRRMIQGASLTFPASMIGNQVEMKVAEARYVAHAARPPFRGGWLLLDGQPPLNGVTHKDLLRVPAKTFPDQPRPALFLRSTASFADVSQPEGWFQYASTSQLIAACNRPGGKKPQPEVQVSVHTRLTRPLLNLILLMLGLPFVAGRGSRNIYLNVGISLVISASFHGGRYLAEILGEKGVVRDPTLAAWLPVFLFGSLAFALFDAVKS